MKSYLFINKEQIGESDLKVIDEGMGGLGGILFVNENYGKYQKIIQQHYKEGGISNSENFNFKIILEKKTELEPAGGIGVTDSEDFPEIYLECAGVDLSKLK